ncbi:hypothetical protein C8F01DRAFT_1081698 [Mycena amicta]|nr:hypothetical protein C8F01DRAFT_1081698 [Mycena amicta]
MDTFFMHSLLRCAERQSEALVLFHNMEHSKRLEVRDGQPARYHACHNCFKILEGTNGQKRFIWAGVTNGVTIGHPCCLKFNCQERLASMKDHFCPRHTGCDSQCRVSICKTEAEPGFITCVLVAHRALEEKMHADSKSAFVDLTRRLEKSNVPCTPRKRKTKTPHAPPSQPPAEAKSAGKLETTRKYTHNDQLFVLPCGIITARTTFFTAEGPDSVQQYLRALFPEPWMLPTHIFYDNARHLLKHIVTQQDTYFDNVNFVIDVFHSRSHDDDFCDKNCLPILFPELCTSCNGKEVWIFNSSVCEQTNIWYGAFQAIVREMAEPRYNFFLDEMVSVYNVQKLAVLKKRGKQPFIMDQDVFKGGWAPVYESEFARQDSAVDFSRIEDPAVLEYDGQREELEMYHRAFSSVRMTTPHSAYAKLYSSG